MINYSNNYPMFKLTGTIKVLNDTVQVNDRFSKREFVVQTGDMYPQTILFQSTQDKCALLDGVQVGEQVEVSFDLRGREWVSPQGEVRFFNSLEAWRIEKVMQQGGNAASAPSPVPPIQPSSGAPQDTNTEEDDLPF
jgi:hypothetical protein